MNESIAVDFSFGPYNGETREVELVNDEFPKYVWVERQEGDFVMLQRYYLTDYGFYLFESKSFGTKSPYVKKYPNGLTKEEIIAKEESK